MTSPHRTLEGMWRGTCKTSVFVECTVDIEFFGANSIRFIFSKCDPSLLEMLSVQTTVYSFADEKAQWLYRHMHITYTTSVGIAASRESKASLAGPWDVNFEDVAADMLLHILCPGKRTNTEDILKISKNYSTINKTAAHSCTFRNWISPKLICQPWSPTPCDCTAFNVPCIFCMSNATQPSRDL